AVRQSLAPLQPIAADHGIALAWRIDPRLPYRLRGQAAVVSRVVKALAEHAIAASRSAAVRVHLEWGGGDANRIRLDLRVGGLDAAHAPEEQPDGEPLALRLIARLVAL